MEDYVSKMLDNVTIDVVEREDGEADVIIRYSEEFKEMLKQLYGRKRFSNKLAYDFFQRPIDKLNSIVNKQWDREENL